jgi:hypothetical protein
VKQKENNRVNYLIGIYLRSKPCCRFVLFFLFFQLIWIKIGNIDEREREREVGVFWFLLSWSVKKAWALIRWRWREQGGPLAHGGVSSAASLRGWSVVLRCFAVRSNFFFRRLIRVQWAGCLIWTKGSFQPH